MTDGKTARRLRAGISGLALAALAGGGWAAPAKAAGQVAQAERTFDFQIPAKPLLAALADFTATTGIQVIRPSAEAIGGTAPAVAGSLTARHGLSRLLAGSGLTFRFTDSRTVILDKAAADGAMTLDPVTVEGTTAAESQLSAASEGTGSYTAKAVTIGKTEQTLREIPQSVSVMTRQVMDDQNMTSVTDVLRASPGISAHGYGGNSAYARGYVLSAQRNGVPSQGSTYDTTYDLAIIDRLEILRGPSGLLTGTGQPGGTVNYVRKRSLDHLAVSGLASVGAWDTYRGVADITGPLTGSGTVRGRVIAAYKEGDTFHDVGHNDKQTFFATFDADVTPDTTIGLTAIYARENYIQNWGLPLYSDGSLPDRSSFVGIDKDSKRRINELAADLTHRFDNGWKIKAAAFRQFTTDDVYGAYATGSIDVNTGLSGVRAQYSESDTLARGVDANVSGPVTLFDREHNLTFGYNWAGSDALSGSNGAVTTNVNPLTTHTFAFPTDITSRSRTRSQQSGYYGIARVKVADPVTVILGGRVTDYSSKSRTETGGTTTAWNRSNARADNEFSPYGGVVVDATKQVSFYASYADIFVPQSNMDYTGSVLDPRVGWQTETGVKGSFYDDRLTASLAAFRIREQNRAVLDGSHTDCNGAGLTCYTAAGTTLIQGFEAEIGGSPLPGFDLTAAYTYIDAKYLSDRTNAGSRFSADTAPKHMLKLWGNYRFGEQALNGDLAGWSAGAGVVAKTLTYNDTVRQDTYAVVSARVGYEINDFLGVSLNVENLLDEKYLLNKGYAGYYTKYEAPRNATLTLTAKW
jgi:TonB-dependent siderophore receptor